jgi:hypothetical protein
MRSEERENAVSVPPFNPSRERGRPWRQDLRCRNGPSSDAAQELTKEERGALIEPPALIARA